MRHTLTLALLLPVLTLAALACEGEEGAESTAAPTLVASPALTATATPTAAVPSNVQAIIDAALSGDPEQLEPLVGYTKVGCITTPQGIGQPPLCREGEAAGTPVDVLSLGTCEGEYRRSDEVGGMLALLSDLILYAVYRWPPSSEPAAEYAVLFSKTAPVGDDVVVELLVQGGRFVHVKFGCGETAQELTEFQQLKDVVGLPSQ